MILHTTKVLVVPELGRTPVSAYHSIITMSGHQHIPTNTMDWEKCDPNQEAIVYGSSGIQLSLVAGGRPRRLGEPVIVFEAGHGGSSASWAAVQRLLDPRVRSYRYDRAGYGRSPLSETPRSAANMAAELLDVLHVAGIAPPYILVAHSYGGIIAREVLAAAGAGPGAVAGMVLVDANQENTHRKQRFPMASMDALCEGQGYFDMIGLTHENSFTSSELAQFLGDLETPDAKEASRREGEALLESADTLAARRQLDTQAMGDQPVTIIRGNTTRDFSRFLAAAQANGAASDREQHVAEFKTFIDRFSVFDSDLQMEQQHLSKNSRFVQATNSGHTVMATEPQLVADEIKAIWEDLCKTGC